MRISSDAFVPRPPRHLRHRHGSASWENGTGRSTWASWSNDCFCFPQPPRSGQRWLNYQVSVRHMEIIWSCWFKLGNRKAGENLPRRPKWCRQIDSARVLADLVPLEAGERELGHNVSVGYFSQQRVETLDLDRTVLDESSTKYRCIRTAGTKSTRCFSLSRRCFQTSQSSQRRRKSRLALVKLLLAPPTFCFWMSLPPTSICSIDALLCTRSLPRHLGVRKPWSSFYPKLGKRTIRIEAGKITSYAGDYDYASPVCQCPVWSCRRTAGCDPISQQTIITNKSP